MLGEGGRGRDGETDRRTDREGAQTDTVSVKWMPETHWSSEQFFSLPFLSSPSEASDGPSRAGLRTWNIPVRRSPEWREPQLLPTSRRGPVVLHAVLALRAARGTLPCGRPVSSRPVSPVGVRHSGPFAPGETSVHPCLMWAPNGVQTLLETTGRRQASTWPLAQL